MNEAVRDAALDLVARARAAGYYAPLPPDVDEPAPHAATAEEVAALQNDLGGRLPGWYIELLTTIPLCGLAFEAPNQYDENDPDFLHFLEWLTPASIRWESLEGWPGLPLLPRGYICVAGINGSGDSLFFSVDEGDDPPLYYIAHDGGGDADTLLANRENFAPSLSAFLRGAIVTERHGN